MRLLSQCTQVGHPRHGGAVKRTVFCSASTGLTTLLRTTYYTYVVGGRRADGDTSLECWVSWATARSQHVHSTIIALSQHCHSTFTHSTVSTL